MQKYLSRKNKNCLPNEIYMAKKTTKTEQPRSTSKTSFFEDVYEVVKQIPKGRVTSYGAIAQCLGTKLSARMVGWAMNGAHQQKEKVPAHRVVNRNGMLSGKAHFKTPDAMQKALEKEGIKVKDDTIVDFEKHFWDPMKELFD
jgi:methylated-DNA-protein-cysteine methyltransferase related protein